MWLTPETIKYPIPEDCQTNNEHTSLDFCRVKVFGDTFRPLTADPSASEHFYAVLQFGKECPPHSVSVSRWIDNEDTGNKSRTNAAPDLLSPNALQTGALGSYTRLFFCLFLNAPSEAETMQEFPELGIAYAVFHDFDGKQPSWVISKTWTYSDDENNNNENAYIPDDGSTAMEHLKTIIESSTSTTLGPNTYFEQARVR